MKRTFSIIFGALAMLVVALVSAFFTMRLSIHGREVDVPNLSGLTFAEAAKAAGNAGLNMKVENRFYSAQIPAGHIMTQSPAAGSRVRRDWQVRVAESLGLQKVEIPNVVGQTQRTAAIELRRLGLDVGTVAHVAVAGDADLVLAQTPPPNASGVESPRVSLLLSQAEDAASAPAFLMPSLTGQSLAAATSRLAAAGLRIAVVDDPAANPAADPGTAAADGSAQPAATPRALPPGGYGESFFPGSSPGSAPSLFSATEPAAVVTAQSPSPGRRVTRSDAIHVTIGH